MLQQNPSFLTWGCQLTQVVLYNGRKGVAVIVSVLLLLPWAKKILLLNWIEFNWFTAKWPLFS